MTSYRISILYEGRYNDNTSRLAMTEALFDEGSIQISLVLEHKQVQTHLGMPTYATGTGMTTAGRSTW